MTKFTVTTDDGRGPLRHESVAFDTEDEAIKEAQRAVADMAKDALPNGQRAEFRASVDDELGRDVYRASLTFSARGRAEIAEEEAVTDDEMRRISSAVQGLNG